MVEAPLRPASTMYAGDHWQAGLEAFRLCKKYTPRAELWVISAAYGLIPATTMVKPYSASFTPGTADAVWRGAHDGERPVALLRWWQDLRHHVHLAELIDDSAQTAVVLTAGAYYLEALRDDLRDAIERDSSAEALSVISAGSKGKGAPAGFDNRFRQIVGGTDSSLNARVLAWIAAEASAHEFRRSSVMDLLQRTNAQLPPLKRPLGARESDREIRSWIRRMRKQTPALSRSRALRELRSAGIACEQSRFKSLWQSVP